MSPQSSIAHYRIVSKIGEGGMGAVYRATDTKLNRDVAIKVLPDSFANDADRLARFAREAQVLASLNHPNIAVIHGVEERALILELVEGPTLAERIAQGPIPVDEALPIAKQIAEALEYAHEKGVVHRDLKPANVKVTPEGRVKVLDFGLAAVAQASAGEAPRDPAASPTLTMRATAMGTIMGSAAYMSPEQARGQAVDRRADIWAFGVVLHEMLTGKALFGGPTISDTLASVLKAEPDLAAIPPRFRPALERCLRKDPRRRWRAIGDVQMALEEVPSGVGAGHRKMPWVIAAALLILAAAGWYMAWRATRSADRPLVRLSVDLGPQAIAGLNLTTAISPDGRRLVFLAQGSDGKTQLATRLLDQSHVMLLPGTENGHDPFFQPDGEWIAFFQGNQLKKISVRGGVPVTLANGQTVQGGDWGADGNIIVSLGNALPLSRIPAAGGTAQLVTKLAVGETTHRFPQILPGGEAVLFTASASPAGMDTANIEAASLRSGQIKILQHEGYSPATCLAAIWFMPIRECCSE